MPAEIKGELSAEQMAYVKRIPSVAAALVNEYKKELSKQQLDLNHEFRHPGF